MDKNKTIYSRIENLARKHQCSPAQLALAWVFKQGQDVAPIPGNWLSFFSFVMINYISEKMCSVFKFSKTDEEKWLKILFIVIYTIIFWVLQIELA